MISSGGGEGSGGGGAVEGVKKGPWTAAEDEVLIEYVQKHGEGNWNAVRKQSRLNRCGKSCRLRWANHLRPNLKKGAFSPDEENLILDLHSKFGNKWARMATHLPGRTDNEIKNYWNTRVKRHKRHNLPLYPTKINHQQQLPSPSVLTNATPTPPTTPSPTNFPFHAQPIQFQPNHSNNHYDPTQTFSFQHREVPILAAPLMRHKQAYPLQHSVHTPLQLQYTAFHGATGFENCGVASPGSVTVKTELPSNQYHHHQQQQQHHHHEFINTSSHLNDFLENLADNEAHMSVEASSEFIAKEEPKDHINSLPEDLSKFIIAPHAAPTLQPLQAVQAHHWYNGHPCPAGFPGDAMHHLTSLYPVASPSTPTTAASTPDYAQNPSYWDTMPGIGKGAPWFKSA